MSSHFKPARFWNYFAFYYPATLLGWVISLVLWAIVAAIFFKIDSHSHSVSDTLLNFSPWAIIILLIFDILCFRVGEYPIWWQKK